MCVASTCDDWWIETVESVWLMCVASTCDDWWIETVESVWLMCVASTCDDWWIETVESARLGRKQTGLVAGRDRSVQLCDNYVLLTVVL